MSHGAADNITARLKWVLRECITPEEFKSFRIDTHMMAAKDIIVCGLPGDYYPTE